MARTKRTVRASTGGKVLHRALAARAARRLAGVWRENGQDVTERAFHGVNRPFIDFEDPSNAEQHLSDLWEHAGRSDISLLWYKVSDGSFRIIYRKGKRTTDVAGVSAAGARLLFGPHVLAFVSSRLARRVWFTSDRCYRLGLTKSLSDGTEYNYCDDPEWIVEFVWCSDGGDGEVKGCYYAVGEGSTEKHMIFLYTMTFDRVPSANETARRGLNSSFGKECSTRMDAILAIDNWCSQNRRKRKRVNFAMTRKVSPLASRYLSTSRTVAFQDNTVLCIRSAVCNDMSLVLDRSAADRLWMAEAARVAAFKRRMNFSPSVHHFTHVQWVIRADHHGTVSLDRVAPPPGAITQGRSSSKLPLWCSSDVSWLLRLPRRQAGVYVLRITDANHLRQVVCIDARMEPGLIYDCAELFAMQLNETSPRFCCPAADRTKFQYFDDMRFLCRTTRLHGDANQRLGQDSRPKKVCPVNQGPKSSHGKRTAVPRRSSSSKH